jgi:uncharacterized membrane protein YGL010W
MRRESHIGFLDVPFTHYYCMHKRMPMKTIESWLEEYAESHRNATNKLIHYICVPAIFFSITGLLYTVTLPLKLSNVPITLAHAVILLVLLYYMRLSASLAIGMLFFCVFCLTLCNAISMVGLKLWIVSLVVFAVAWIGQFIGHHIEGKKPSFLKDIQFLLIGPAWIMHKIYTKFGIVV